MTYYFLSVKCFIGVNPFCTALPFNLVCLCLMVVRHVSQIFLWFCHIVFDGLRKEESIFCLVLPPATLIKCHFLPAVLIPPLHHHCCHQCHHHHHFVTVIFAQHRTLFGFTRERRIREENDDSWWTKFRSLLLVLMKCELFYRMMTKWSHLLHSWV